MLILELLLLYSSIFFNQVRCEEDLAGSGEMDYLPPSECDLATCVAPNRTELLLSASLIDGLPPPDCSLDCSIQAYSSCTQCTFSKPVFPDSSIYALEIPESQAVTGNVHVSITGISESFNDQQTSMVVIVDTEYSILINVETLACSEFLVEYTLSNNVKEKQTVCLNYTPPSPSNVSYDVTSVCTNGDYKTAAITINWDQPTDNFNYWIFGYNVTLSNGNNLVASFIAAKNDSSITISNGTELNNQYSLIITPHPAGFATTLEINTNLAPSTLVSDCFIKLDPMTVTYTYTLTWTITNFDCSIANRIIRFEVGLTNFTTNGNGFRLLENNVGETKTVYTMPFTSSYKQEFTNIPYVSNAGYESTLTTFHHGPDSPFTNIVNQVKCDKNLVVSPPTVVTAINVTNFTYHYENIASLTISWVPPEYINGHDVVYSLWVGLKSLPLDASFPSGSTLNNEIRYSKNIHGLSDSLTLDNIHTTSPVLYIQLISTNDLCMMVTPSCHSNWSEPLEYRVPPPTTIDKDWTTTTHVNSINMTPQSASVMITNSRTNYLATPSKAPDSTNLTRLIPPLVGVVGGLFVTVVILVAIVTCCCCFGGRLLKRDIAMDPMIKMDDPNWRGGGNHYGKILHSPYHIPFQSLDLEEWEIPRDFLEVYEKEILGSGCFGEVFKGSLHMQYVHTKKRLSHNHKIHQKLPNVKPKEWLPVAVKRLKRTADGKEKADFLKEIDTIIKVSETDSELKRFVVNTLGCCRLHEPILLVVEYVSCGDLLHYLRAEKKKAQGDTEPIPYLESIGEYSHLEPRNKVSDLEGNLNSKHLLDFSRQIAAGMEFLSGLYIVHRDLACRNILVNGDRTLKISDFGLARTVPQDEVYTLTNHGRLPLRWMALESIFQREFTSASDVWSFGVVLWEICTMGKFPYGSLSEKELLQRMKKGYRLEQPDNCSQEIFEMMHRCWHPVPSKRPKFSDLHKLLDLYLTKYTQDKYPYIDLDSNAPYTFDQLVPKSLSDYQTHMKEVLTIEDITNGDVTEGKGQNNPIYLDNRHKPESDAHYLQDSSDPEYSLDESPATKLPVASSHGGHVGLYRLQNPVRDQTQYVQPYDQLRHIDEDLYDREEMMDTLNTIYMEDDHNMAVDMDDYYYQDELWRKKLSTITEASNEDY